MSDQRSIPQETHWLRRPDTIRKLWRWGLILLVLVTLLDVVVVGHPYFGIDGTFGFYSWYGLLTCAAMVVAAKALGIFLKQGDDYYDD